MTMSIRRGAAAMAAVALLGLPLVALADNKHVSEAVEHAKGAVNHGKQGHADAVAQHAEEALKHGLQTTTGGTSSSRPSSVQHTWLQTLLHFGQMCHRAFRMLGRLVCVTGLAVGDGFL